MKANRSFIGGLVAVTLFLAAAQSQAAGPGPDRIYMVREGEDLHAIAHKVYGDERKQILIMAVNNIQHPRLLRTGERLKIPSVRMYRAQPGDTLRGLAIRFLGDARRARPLGKANRIGADAVPAGRELVLPYHLVYRVHDGETFPLLARAFYRDGGKATLLRAYNFKKGRDRLATGERVVIPLFDVRVKSSALAPVAGRGLPPMARGSDAEPTVAGESQGDPPAMVAPVAAQPTPSPAVVDDAMRARWRKALTDGATRFERGDYAETVNLLEPLLVEPPPPGGGLDGIVATAYQLLASSHVALGQRTKALTAARRALERRPDLVLDPVLVSPKVRALFDEARGGDSPGRGAP